LYISSCLNKMMPGPIIYIQAKSVNISINARLRARSFNLY
jgi:hypothetical protein